MTESVADVRYLDQLLEECLPSFGGAFLRRLWTLLDEAVGLGLPMTLSVAGPVTLSGQGRTWLGPLLDTGWFCLLSTTDAVCYHDGHRALDEAKGDEACAFETVDEHRVHARAGVVDFTL